MTHWRRVLTCLLILVVGWSALLVALYWLATYLVATYGVLR